MNRILWLLLAAAVATSMSPADSAAAASLSPEWRRVEIEGTSMAWTDRGSGEPVVLVHGSLGDLRSWRAHMQSLAKGFRVIAYSRRYHHPNPAPTAGAEYSIARDVRDLAALIRLLELGSVHLVGHGRGAEVCARFAVEHPEAVRSLVLCEAALPGLIPGSAEAAAYTTARNEIRQRVKFALRDGFPDVALRAYFDSMYGSIRVETLSDSVLGRARSNLDALRLEMNASAPADFDCEDAKSIKVPVLLLNGGRSPDGMRSFAAAFAACRPGTERLVFDRAGHDVPREASGGFAKAVSRFLIGLRAPPLAGE